MNKTIPFNALKTLIVGSLLLSSVLANAANSLSDAEVAIMDDLRKAEQQLNETERSISQQRTALANQLSKAEREIRELREETAASRRLADEATLSIQQLEERLESWEEQSFFQHNLLGRFSQQANTETWAIDKPLTEKITWLSKHINEQQIDLYPVWQESEIVMPNGELQSAQQLSLGPVSWFWQEASQAGGFVTEDAGRSEVSLVFDNSNNNQSLGEFFNNQQGSVIFDPTLSRALRLAQEKESFIDHIKKGGLWAFPILTFAAFALLIALGKTLQLSRLPKVIPAVAQALQDNDQTILNNVKGMQAEIINIMQITSPGQIRDDQLFAQLMEFKHRLDYWLGAIAITAAVAPLLGLLGTVSGMIEAFRLMTIFGAGDPAAVSSGISEALVTTELGLVVAIPSLVLHALLSRKVKSYFGQLENCAVKLSQVEVGSAQVASNANNNAEGLPA